MRPIVSLTTGKQHRRMGQCAWDRHPVGRDSYPIVNCDLSDVQGYSWSPGSGRSGARGLPAAATLACPWRSRHPVSGHDVRGCRRLRTCRRTDRAARRNPEGADHFPVGRVHAGDSPAVAAGTSRHRRAVPRRDVGANRCGAGRSGRRPRPARPGPRTDPPPGRGHRRRPRSPRHRRGRRGRYRTRRFPDGGTRGLGIPRTRDARLPAGGRTRLRPRRRPVTAVRPRRQQRRAVRGGPGIPGEPRPSPRRPRLSAWATSKAVAPCWRRTASSSCPPPARR